MIYTGLICENPFNLRYLCSIKYAIYFQLRILGAENSL